MYSVISVKLDSLPGNTKKQGIDPFVVDQSAISPSLGGYISILRLDEIHATYVPV